MNKVLFIGSFLSIERGTLSIPERLKNTLIKNQNLKIVLASSFGNKILRLCDIAFNILFASYHVLHVDVFSNQAFVITRVSLFLASFKKRKTILTLHGGKLNEYYLNHKLSTRKVLKKATYIQTPSLFLKQFFEKEGFNVHYLPNPLELEKFPYDRNLVKPFSLLWVRAFDTIYNPWLAIETLAEVVKVFPQATLTMVGPDKGELREAKLLAKKLKISNRIDFKGAVPNEQLFELYQTHHVYLNTTNYESFGVAVCEAAACGIPIISTNVGEIPYLWQHGINIMLINEFSSLQMGATCVELMSDSDKIASLSKSARTNIEKFSMEIILPQWVQLFNSVGKAN